MDANIVPQLGDRLGAYLDIVAAVGIGAALVVIVISIISVIRRK